MKDWQPTSIAKRTLAQLTLGLCAMTAAGSVFAETGHEQIQHAVREYVESFYTAEELRAVNERDPEESTRRVDIDISAIDPRLPLALCEQPLYASINQNQRAIGRVNVKVECHGTSPWTKYLPANIRVYEKVLTTTRPLARGEIISESDFSYQEIDVSTLRYSYIQSPELAIGMELKRSMPANATLVQESLEAPTLVKRGDTVVLSAQAGTVEIRQQGVALQSGELGAQINVRNSSSERTVQAVVTGYGQAKVGF